MRGWTPDWIADAAGARLLSASHAPGGPERVVIDSREAGPGALFVGLRGRHADGGAFAHETLAAGAWGVLVAPEHAEAALRKARDAGAREVRDAGAREVTDAAVLAADDPLQSLHRLANAWRRELGAKVIGVTGSTGKTSTKDLLLAVLAPHRRTVASRANFNTEIGLPLEILAAPAGTEVLVLEMAMRGAGQIAELTAIAEPDVGVIVSVGPVHLELLGAVEAVAAAKAELIANLRAGSTAVVPHGEELLAPHLRADLSTITFGDGGDVRLLGAGDERLQADLQQPWADDERLRIDVSGRPITLDVSFHQAHLRRNLLAAVAAASAVGVVAEGRVELALTPGRGERAGLPGGVTLIDDCYNANPMSMRAALEDLAATAAREAHSRTVAVLGDMLELGPGERQYHAEVGDQAASAGVDLLVTVGPRAAAISERFAAAAHSPTNADPVPSASNVSVASEPTNADPPPVHAVADAQAAAALLPTLLQPGDVVLVKGSRGVGLELVCRALRDRDGAAV